MTTQTLDWNEYIETARAVAAEGTVLIENNGVLPFSKGTKLAVFGRIQANYYKSGTGSGGMVAVDHVITIPEALKQTGTVELNAELESIYTAWLKEHPFDEGVGWAAEPWSQEEMPVSSELAKKIAAQTDTALYIVGRTAGEEQDNKDEEGSYRLSKTEEEVLAVLRQNFKKLVVVLNVGNTINMDFIAKYKPDAVLYAWHGGMVGALGTADVLCGKVCPSGRLTDTIAKKIEDYPAFANFGSEERNFYCEDIYVGYRYFETLAPEAVLYPFGYGLSYSTFKTENQNFNCDGQKVTFDVKVTNTGSFTGKHSVLIFANQPQGKLGKPKLVLCSFAKTAELKPSESQILNICVKLNDLASFDDTGKTGNKSCMVLEAGKYNFYSGSDVKNIDFAGSFDLALTIVTEKLSQALTPQVDFERFVPVQKGDKFEVGKELLKTTPNLQVKHRAEALEALKNSYKIEENTSSSYTFSDFAEGKITAQQFLSTLSNDDLSSIVRGEGMGSPKVTPGTAAAFGGVNKHLQSLGVPCGCCTDGPSGLRLDSGNQAFSMPNGTMQACTFNPELITKLYTFTSLELIYNKVDILLGPGMNIHRYPLCGRNFEYFSEDPLITGKFGAAIIRGLHTYGVTGSAKHFCGNNQELKRQEIDSIISERALREIYLKGFEILVKEAGGDVMMTTYGSVNGTWTGSNYDLNTQILRNEWGFKGIVMTDWWANLSEENGAPNKTNFAAMVKAQNDLYMVCSDASANNHGDNTLTSLEKGSLERAELLRCAENILTFLAKSESYKRLQKCGTVVKIINRPDTAEDEVGDITYYTVEDEFVIDLQNVECQKGTSYSFALDVPKPGLFHGEIVGKTESGSVAQVPVTLRANGVSAASFTWNGTNGEWVALEKDLPFFTRYTVAKLYFAQNGLKLKQFSLKRLKDIDPKLMFDVEKINED